jgi:hypothetical protein
MWGSGTGVVMMAGGAERFVHDALDGVHAAAALPAAAEAAMDLAGRARGPTFGMHGAADIVVTEDVAGADDHLSSIQRIQLSNSELQSQKQKENLQFQLIPNSPGRFDVAQKPRTNRTRNAVLWKTPLAAARYPSLDQVVRTGF